MSTLQNGFVHIVLFWLKDKAHAAQLQEGLHSLAAIDHARMQFVGTPAETDRPVIDRSYDFCLTLVFGSKADHDAYQIHPVHQQFVREYSHLWDRVLIYDAD